MTKFRAGLFQYVRHKDIAAREAEGWTVEADLGPYHGQYCVLMRLPERGKDGEARKLGER
jgi:hypothetical protein